MLIITFCVLGLAIIFDSAIITLLGLALGVLSPIFIKRGNIPIYYSKPLHVLKMLVAVFFVYQIFLVIFFLRGGGIPSTTAESPFWD